MTEYVGNCVKLYKCLQNFTSFTSSQIPLTIHSGRTSRAYPVPSWLMQAQNWTGKLGVPAGDSLVMDAAKTLIKRISIMAGVRNLI